MDIGEAKTLEIDRDETKDIRDSIMLKLINRKKFNFKLKILLPSQGNFKIKVFYFSNYRRIKTC